MNFNNQEPNIKHRIKHKNLKRNSYTIPGSQYYNYYKIYNNFMSRCYNPELPQYKYYGAKGITVCEEWRTDFNQFFSWLLDQGYEAGKGLSIERLDEAKGYSPDNCIIVDTNINRTFKGNTSHYIINNHYIVSYSGLEEVYPEFRNDMRELHNIGLDEDIPNMLKELGIEDTIKFMTKTDIYKKLELI